METRRHEDTKYLRVCLVFKGGREGAGGSIRIEIVLCMGFCRCELSHEFPSSYPCRIPLSHPRTSLRPLSYPSPPPPRSASRQPRLFFIHRLLRSPPYIINRFLSKAKVNALVAEFKGTATADVGQKSQLGENHWQIITAANPEDARDERGLQAMDPISLLEITKVREGRERGGGVHVTLPPLVVCASSCGVSLLEITRDESHPCGRASVSTHPLCVQLSLTVLLPLQHTTTQSHHRHLPLHTATFHAPSTPPSHLVHTTFTPPLTHLHTQRRKSWAGVTTRCVVSRVRSE